MARKPLNLGTKKHDFNIERFKARLLSKFVIVFVAVVQLVTRLTIVFTSDEISENSRLIFFITLPLFILQALIVCFEYILFKKIGPKVMDYSKLIDLIILITFGAEWIATVCTSLTAVVDGNPPTLQFYSIFGFSSFGWRCLFLLFLIQSWKLLILPPTIGVCIAIGFAIHYDPGDIATILLRGVPQIVFIILMLYCQDRLRWKEVFTNVQQERWMQVNDFVLNNIPENIVILELGGQVRFVSDYCKAFMKKAHLSQDPKELFATVKELYQQPETEPSSPSNVIIDFVLSLIIVKTSRQTERAITFTTLLDPTSTNQFVNFQKVDDLEELIRNFKAIARDANLLERQFLIYNGKLKVEDHNTKSVEIKISFIQEHNKDYIVLIVRDTTQRDLLVTLEDNNKYKDQLLASVSHELRAPLNGNINLLESAIQNVSVPDNIKEKLLTPALRSSKFLLHLINDILDMSQIKVQKLRLIFKPALLQETLNDTLQLVELQAKKKNIELCLTMHPDMQGIICTDHVRLSQIVLNLLNNAIKFTQKGRIILSASPADDPNCVKISVQDSGIGMKKEDVKKLFADYTHIEFENRSTINPTGVGLGLSIAYNLAKLLGPKSQKGITVDSVVGIGSTFFFLVENKEEPTLQLNLQSVTLKKSSDKSWNIPEEYQVMQPKVFPRLHKSFSTNLVIQVDDRLPLTDTKRYKCNCPKILIVDDNPFNTMAFETILNSIDMTCDCVFDGMSAIDKLLDREKNLCGGNCKSYSIIFMDQEMPGMNGSETVREIRKLQLQRLIPPMKIIGCTAHGSSEEVDKFMDSGIEMCIHKPITSHEVQKLVKSCEF